MLGLFLTLPGRNKYRTNWRELPREFAAVKLCITLLLLIGF
jgi:hypothetical protein